MKRDNKSKVDTELFRDIVWGVQHDAFDDDRGWGRSLLRAWKVGALDDQLAGEVHNLVRPLRTREAFGDLPPFRKPHLPHGEILLGHDQGGNEVLLPAQWLTAGLLLASNTGGGKSTLLNMLIVRIAATGCRVWVSDMYKTQARHLLPLLVHEQSHSLVLRARDWKNNLLQTKFGDPRTHLVVAIDLLVRVLGLPPRARTILGQAGYDLYAKFGIWEGKVDAWPCLFDLYEWIYTAKKINAAAREAILDRLAVLLVGLTPECAAYRLAWDPVDLARYSIVFEMRGTSESVKQLLLEPALFSVMHHEIERGLFNRPLDLFVAFEDSQRFFNSGQESTGGEIAPMDELAGIIRGSGKGLGVIVQTMQGVSLRLTPNLATKVMGRMGTHLDYTRLGADLSMNRDQIEWAKRNLRPGVFVAQVSESDWREPFVFRVKNVKLPNWVSDADAARSVQALNALPTTPASEYARWEPQHITNLSETSPAGRLSDPTLRFLEAVIAEPGKPSSAYAKIAGISGSRAAEIRKELTKSGYLREHKVATGRRGRNSIVLEPLQSAYEATEQGGGV